MAVEFNVLTIDYYNQFNNGENLDQNLTDSTKNLVGNVTDKIRVRQNISVSWTSEATSSVVFFRILNNQIEFIGGDFVNDGFTLGDIISVYDSTGLAFVFEDREVLTINGNLITFDGAAVAPGGIFEKATMYGKTPLTVLRFKFGLIENNEITNYISKIDGTAENSLFSRNVGFDTGGGVRSLVPVSLDPISGVNSWKEDFGSATVAYISTKSQIEKYAQLFEINHYFTILPFYLDGYLTNLQNLSIAGIGTRPSLFAGTNTLKYVYSAGFNADFNNPVGQKIGVVDNQLGSVGWFIENFNGNQTAYNIRSLVYTNQDTLQVVDRLNSQQKTKVVFEIKNSFENPFTANSQVQVGISILPDPSEYQQNSQTIEQNFIIDNAFTTAGLAPVASSIIDNFTVTFTDVATLTCEFDVDYLTSIEPLLENKNYVIWASTCDEFKSAPTSDRVCLKVDTKLYDYNPDIKDLIFIDEINHFPHNINDTVLTDGYDDYKGWIEDGFEIVAPFQLNNDLNAGLSTLSVHLSAWNPTTDDRFDLQSYNYSLSSATIINPPGVNQYKVYDINTTRGFNLVNGSQFNNAVLTTQGPGLRGPINVIDYELRLGIKANFEEWIALPGADTIFYAANEPNNGLNLKSSNYSLKLGYELVVFIDARMAVVVVNPPNFIPSNVFTNYQFLSQPHEYYDYNLDNNATPDWAVEILTIDENGANTSGIVETSINTTVRATFTPLSGTTDLVDPYGIIRLNQSGGTIQTINELSTIRESIVGNPLIPLVGENYTKLTDDGLTVVLECLIEGSSLDASLNYDISATLRDAGEGIETELGVLLATELNDIIIIE